MRRAIAGLALALVAGAAPAQKAGGLEELLQQIRQGGQQSALQNKEREARFLRERGEQAGLLARAEGELAQAKAKADAVKARYDANQREIGELKAQLQTRAGDYTQVYAVVRQMAGDLVPVIGESLVSGPHPDRVEFLEELAARQELPSVADLEQLWFVVQQEMTEGAQVARFEAEIADEEGVRRKAEVVRIGPFSAFADGEYLAPVPGSGELTTLARQPDEYEDIAEEFADLDEGWGAAVIDPSRGGLLALAADRPGLKERLDQGGLVAYVIIVIGALGTVAAAFQLGYLMIAGARVRRQLAALDAPSADNPLGRVLGALRADRSADPELLELHLSEAVLRETPRIERFQSLIRMIVAAGPLLGLLGTVSGMIITFQVITEIGAADPKAMAGGISQAMITTLLGLGIAIPLLFINALLASRSRALVQVLDEQSAGLLAKRLEAARGRA